MDRCADLWLHEDVRRSPKERAWVGAEHEVRKIYGELGLKGMTPAFKTTRPAKGRYKHPYLLRGRKALCCNEIWASDITYIKLGDRVVYFTAIIDMRSRKILSWRLSEKIDTGFYLDAFLEVLVKYGVPSIFNADAGSLSEFLS